MNTTTILYPALAMFCLTLSCIFAMGFARFIAIQKRQVSIRFYRTYNEGSQPKKLHLLARHVQNHFEAPPLFYVGVIFSYITQNEAIVSLVFAWLFVAARVVHSIIHLGSNNVTIRFVTYGFSLLCLCGLWGSVFYPLLLL